MERLVGEVVDPSSPPCGLPPPPERRLAVVSRCGDFAGPARRLPADPRAVGLGRPGGGVAGHRRAGPPGRRELNSLLASAGQPLPVTMAGSAATWAPSCTCASCGCPASSAPTRPTRRRCGSCAPGSTPSTWSDELLRRLGQGSSGPGPIRRNARGRGRRGPARRTAAPADRPRGERPGCCGPACPAGAGPDQQLSPAQVGEQLHRRQPRPAGHRLEVEPDAVVVDLDLHVALVLGDAAARSRHRVPGGVEQGLLGDAVETVVSSTGRAQQGRRGR